MMKNIGDEGTSLDPTQHARRLMKCAPIFDVLGELDELVAVMGVAKEYVYEDACEDCVLIGKSLESLQRSLINVSFFISTFQNHDRRTFNPVDDLEKTLEMMEEKIVCFSNTDSKGLHLVIASGGKASTHLYHARSVCRRFERTFLRFLSKNEGPAYMHTSHVPTVLAFINRLSDFLFHTARHLAKDSEVLFN